MSVAFVGIGTGTDSSTASVTLPFPGGTAIAAGNMGVALLAFWDPARALPTLQAAALTAGWKHLADTKATGGGGGTYGLDAGPRDVAAYWWVSDGVGTSVALTLADGDTGAGCRGYVMSFSKTLNKWATPLAVAGEDSTNATSFSVAGASDFDGAGSVSGDMLAIGVVNRPDSATQGSPACAYASGTYTQQGSGAATAGHDGRHNCGTVPCSGTSGGAPTFTSTLSASGTGSAIFVRLRDLDEISRPSLATIQAVNRSVL